MCVAINNGPYAKLLILNRAHLILIVLGLYGMNKKEKNCNEHKNQSLFYIVNIQSSYMVLILDPQSPKKKVGCAL